MSQSVSQTAVLVVGAGPTGLLLAAELQRRGVPCHLIEAQPAPLHWDRATVVHPRSLQIFESLGLAEQFLSAGCRQRVIKIHSGGKLLGTIDLAGCGSIYGFNVGLSEEVTESILTGYLHQHGGQVNRSSRLVGMTITPDNRVIADLERDGDRYQIEARWVVGCDGLHSATRHLAGIGFEGHDMLKPWAVFDASVEPWAHTFEAIFVYLEALPVILTALPGHRWRVYLLPGSEESDLVADATSTLHAYEPSAHFVDIENPARFRCHTKIATKYRSGPIFLAGDAAHLCSPGEGHGMNCGLQDAFNLAWKLALVHQATAHETLLDSYEIERRPAAELVMKSGDEMEKTLNMVEILRELNRSLTGNLHGGFVTCLAMRIHADGAVALANAGHLAPYHNGVEIPMSPSLPLGIIVDAEYTETSLRLTPGDTFTFFSDGVVEAQSPTGELFGFERTGSISRKSAQEIADVAQAFGQEDDITVLTLQFAPA